LQLFSLRIANEERRLVIASASITNLLQTYYCRLSILLITPRLQSFHTGDRTNQLFSQHLLS